MIIGSASERNNFTILRLFLAWLVFFGHFKLLQGDIHPSFPFIYADFAVDAFFVVSGYLITLSFDNDGNLRRFYIRRLFRLYPLYLAVVAAMTVTMDCLATGTPQEILVQSLRFFAVNAVFLNFLQYDIDGVTRALTAPGLNPSLWTLKIEVAFYLVLPFVWILVRRWGSWVLALVFALSVAWDWGFQALGMWTIAKQLPGQMQFFVLGMALYRYGSRLPARSPVWLLAMVPLAVFVTFWMRSPVFYPLAVAALVFGVACRTRPIGLHLDISYGVYLLHGPVIQVALLLGIFSDSIEGFVLAAICILLLAMGAEATIERPFIALGRRLSRGVRTTPVLSVAANG